MIETVYREHGAVEVVDVGGTVNYWRIVPTEFLRRHNVTITLVNLPGTSAQLEDRTEFRAVEADGCDLKQFGDQEFHIAHSNSVLEHVGDWGRMVAFAQEIARVAPRLFVQTPNYWFPIEPHCMTPFFHWLPTPMRVWLVMHFQLGHWNKAKNVDEAVRIVDSARLVNRKMFQSLFGDAEIRTERVLWLPKSFIAIRK
jgi:hypothetical protein